MDPFDLVDEKKTPLFPSTNQTDFQNFNSIVRIVLIIFIILKVKKYRFANLFLFISTLFLILINIFFINKRVEKFMSDNPPEYKYPYLGSSNNKMSNQRLSLPPVIAPRSHDSEIWSFPSYKHSAINYKNAGYDISNQYYPIPDKINYEEQDYRISSFTNIGLAPNVSSTIAKIGNPAVGGKVPNPDTTPVDQLLAYDIPISENDSLGLSGYSSLTNLKPNTRQGVGSLSGKGVIREGFGGDGEYNNSIDNGYQHIPKKSNSGYQRLSLQEPEGIDFPKYPNQELLMVKQNGDNGFSDLNPSGMVSLKERTKYFENIEPTALSYSDISYPINNNLGISFTPSNPPVFQDQVASNEGDIPLYHRVDPQLIRDRGLSEERMRELPQRNPWSAKYSGLEAGDGTVNFEDIYDPRFNGYGDGTRAYTNTNGQIQYYYSDVDSYRKPNFSTRSKVDFNDYVDPMGRVIPEYIRNVGLSDVKKDVENQFIADEIFRRENLMESQMRKRNSELWQLRARPVSSAAHAGSFSSNY
jgi:hypothetical protein